MDMHRKRRRQSSVKQGSIRTHLHSSRGTLSSTVQQSKVCEQVGQLSRRVLLRNSLQPRGRHHDLQSCDCDFKAQDAVGKRTRRGQRRSEFLSGAVTYDCNKAQNVRLDYQHRRLAETEGQNTTVPAKRARPSISAKHDAVCNQSHHSSLNTARCTDLCPVSEPTIKNPVAAGTMYRLPGRIGKRRSGTRQESVSYSLQYCLLCKCLLCIVNTPVVLSISLCDVVTVNE